MSVDGKFSLIGFDADDTLWEHADFYRQAEQRLINLLAGFGDDAEITKKLREVELRNLPLYGFGVKGFTLSMIETTIELTGGRAPLSLIKSIISSGHELLKHPIELLPHVAETLAELSGIYRLVLITRGDLFDQERKLEESGLRKFFEAVEIVSDKNVETYRRISERHGMRAGRAMMVGNSLKSDVIPALEAGYWGVHVPQPITWVVEHFETSISTPRFRRINNLGELVQLIGTLD
ncbi:HAD family hydrolase [Rhizobium sp. 2YAF20]|uniref:HAD family hydrolase n=1 Tax=Rhizobium sp. 2YAF20 TaxID=3233027 RepID=UPI003F9D81E5